MRRRLFIVVGVLAAVAGVVLAGGIILVTTFDLDRYRPMVVTQLEELLRKPVSLERLSLGWRGGISLEIKNFAIYLNDQQKVRPLLQVNRASLTVPFRVLRNLSLTEEIPFKGMVAVFGNTPNITFQGQALLAPGGKGISQLQTNLRVEDLLLEPFFPSATKTSADRSAGAAQPQVRGKLSGSFHGSLEGPSTGEIVRRFSGGGELELKELTIVNLNILREVFQRISVIPGLAEALASRLPESYREKLNARDTFFKPVDLTVTVANGVISLTNLQIATDTFELSGSAQLDMKGGIYFPAQIRITPQLSAAVIRSVQELQGLVNARGELELPVLIQGTLPQVSVMPEVGYVASALLTTKAEDLLGSLLQKALKKKE